MTDVAPRLCSECRVGAHDHCACECEVCAHRYDHVLLAKIAEMKQGLEAEREAFVLLCDQQSGGWIKIGSHGSAVEMQKALSSVLAANPKWEQERDKLEQVADGGVLWAQNAEHFRQRAERAEARLVKAMAALKEMRTTYVENRHAREWARFLETALECCGLCGQEIDPRFHHECPAHYVDLSSGVTYGGKAK